jgi:molybdenum cofactor cytidylyltransferase
VISAVILAAGTSSRLGRPKQLLDLGGKPVLRHVVDAALAAGLDDVVVVLGHAAEQVAAALPDDTRLRTTLNPWFAEGQSTSLAAGLEALGDETQASVILLGDQPGVRPEAIAAVVRAFIEEDGPVVQAAYDGRPAHPTLLARAVWPKLLSELAGDEGARGVLTRHPDWVRPIRMAGPAPLDIDTEDDYLRIRAQFSAGDWPNDH